MSKTACWGFNEDTDCANVFFGWPSRWDQCGNTTNRGFQLSKKALKLLLYYDYEIEYNSHPIIKDDLFRLKIDFEPSKLIKKWNTYDLQQEDIEKLSTYSKMHLSYLHIVHPNWEEWFNECKSISGRFIKITGRQSAPKLEEIKKVNKPHYDVISRIFEMNNKAVKNYPKKDLGLCYATEEDMERILDEWDEEDKIRKQTEVEKWKKINKEL